MKRNDGEAQAKKLPEGKVPEEVHKEPKDVPNHGNEQVTELTSWKQGDSQLW